jgi:pilus assembly protein Flp/PilA
MRLEGWKPLKWKQQSFDTPRADPASSINFHLPCSLELDQYAPATDSASRENPAFRSRTVQWKENGEGFMRLLTRFWRDETGATAIEYGLIAAGIALAIIGVVNGLGTKLNSKFSSINSSLK